MLASAVVQASQGSSGGECPSHNKPQNVVSLLQTKLQMNVLEDGLSMMKNPSAMLTELEGMVRSGETPAFDLITTIKNLIDDDISPCLQSTRDAAAEETTHRLSAFQLCNNQSKRKEGEIEGVWSVLVDNARSNHTDCREEEGDLCHSTESISFAEGKSFHSESCCTKLGEFLHQATPLQIPDGSTRAEAVQYVKDASNTKMCALSEVTELDACCKAETHECADKKAECDIKQKSFESAFCTWKVELESNCKALDECYSAAETDYDSHVEKTQPLVEKWNGETAALQKILCYCNVWLSEKDDRDNRSKHNATEFDICKDQTHMPDTVNYGTPAAKAACLLTSVADYPGMPGFETEYASFSDLVLDTVPCAQATTTVPTTTVDPRLTPD